MIMRKTKEGEKKQESEDDPENKHRQWLTIIIDNAQAKINKFHFSSIEETSEMKFRNDKSQNTISLSLSLSP